MKKLSAKQQQILEYITEATARQGYPPSVREIGDHVGLSSSSSVHAHLIKLREKGYLQKDDHKTRAVVVKGSATAVPQVPILGQVTAGMPILAVEQIEGKRTNGNETFFITFSINFHVSVDEINIRPL